MKDRMTSIDVQRLDEEWIKQADLYEDAATAAAEAQKEYDLAKSRLEVVEAEVEQEVRDDPNKFKLKEPVRENGIKTAVTLDPRHRRADKRMIECKYNLNILKAREQAMDHKKKALENLVVLEGRNYFSTPRAADQESKEKMDLVKKKALRAKRRG